ncbi:MAG: hypothetical protein CM1200mP18_17750 [Gammaproteobacteria bacterium]|nr:MAG: hypothetical protein CM1200mP18_17750 [Gammaproteobacteria bacterium]
MPAKETDTRLQYQAGLRFPEPEGEAELRTLLKKNLLFVLLLITPSLVAADRLSLILDWFVNPDHGPIIIAQENGYFTEQGLEVEIIAPADAADPPKLVAAGKVDLAISYQPQLHLQVHAGLPLVRVGTLVATPLNCLWCWMRDPSIPLLISKGRKIGYSVAGVEEALLIAILWGVMTCHWLMSNSSTSTGHFAFSDVWPGRCCDRGIS